MSAGRSGDGFRRRAIRKRRGKKPKRSEVWQRLAEERGGEVELDRRARPERLHVPHRSWRIVLDSHVESSGSTSSTHTRVRALFVRVRPFTLRVTRRNPFHALGPLVGYRGVGLSYGPMDRKLFVRSDDPTLARSLLRGTAVGQSLLGDPARQLVVKRPDRRIRKMAGDGVGEVRVQVGGDVRELARLRALIDLCCVTLDELERLGAASDAPVEDAAI